MAISPSYGDGADKGAGRMSTSAAWTPLKRGACISVTKIAGEVDGEEPKVPRINWRSETPSPPCGSGVTRRGEE